MAAAGSMAACVEAAVEVVQAAGAAEAVEAIEVVEEMDGVVEEAAAATGCGSQRERPFSSCLCTNPGGFVMPSCGGRRRGCWR